MSGLLTIGIVLLEVITAVAVIAYFRTRPERHALAAPLIGLLGPGLGIATVAILKNVLTLSRAHSTLVNALLCVVIAAASRSGRTRCANDPADRIAMRRLAASRARPVGSGWGVGRRACP
jgi:hypothetical protein